MHKPKLFAALVPIAAYHKGYLRSQIAKDRLQLASDCYNELPECL